MPYTRAPDVEAIDGRTPTPRVKGNLPPVREGSDRGREVPARKMEWYERGNPRSTSAGTYAGQWEDPPKPPPGVDVGRTMSDREVAEFHRANKFADGGAVYRREPPPRQAFNPKGPGYDDETADWEGMQAEISPEDNKPHGFSRVPRTGMLLKGREHPTFDKAVEEDRRLGYGLEMRDGRYYTQPFAKHEQGGMVEQPSCKYGSSTVVTCRSK